MKLFNFILDKLMTYRIGAMATSGNMNEGKNDSNYSII